MYGSCSLLHAHFRVHSFPSLAVDPRRGHLFVTWGDYASGSATAFIIRSTDGGASWSPARFVSNASPKDPNNCLLSVYLNANRGGGLGFGKAVRVSSAPFNPDVQFGGGFIGDYIGVAAAPGRAHPIWTDTRRVGLCAPKQDAVTSR